MSKKQIISSENYATIIDYCSLFLAVVFLISVIKNAAVASGHVAGGNWGSAPVAYALILGLILVFINWYQSKGRVSVIGIVALTILLTSAAIWMLGLHTVWPLGQRVINPM
ncbi:MAG TPA: hypothetical protein VM124_03640 [Candidatus Limnocylindrales bacterium]|nr:hypothetical protein [Candidatus Limnocylindrales bacterium]